MAHCRHPVHTPVTLNTMNTFEEIDKRLSKIEARNIKVEIDKAWETSITRKILLILFTYFSIALYLKYIIGVEPWLNAIVPALGFLLSTLSLPFFKKIWCKFLHKKYLR